MTLPTFLGIGVPRAGTTWLHGLLDSHPDVYVPTRRKELYYFDLHYGRGVEWYEKFFPADADAGQYRAIGEITPYYFFCRECPERIATMGIGKLLLMLRNPVDRAWSYYSQKVQNRGFSGSFEDFLTFAQTKWPVVEQGYYSRYLRTYLRHFERDQILILIYEQAVANVPSTKRTVAEFLDVSADRFPATAGERRINRSHVPKARRAYSLAFQVSRVLRARDFDWVVNTAKRLGIKKAFGVAGEVPPMTEPTRERLREVFRPEIDELEELLGVSLAAWR